MVHQPYGSLQIKIATQRGTVCTPTSIPLQIDFNNTNTVFLRLLNKFEPLPVFFSFAITQAGGKMISVPGGGKIDMMDSMKKYATILVAESFSIHVDVGTILYEPLTPGIYQIYTTYHNQYGENCFVGTAQSNTIMIKIL